MQIDAQDYLRLVEKSKTLAFVDIEATGLKGDYNSVLVVSIKPYGEKPYSIVVNQVGNDVGVVMEAAKELAKYDCWATYYGKGFDIPMLNTRLMKWGKKPIPKRHHLDLYYTIKAGTVMSRRSMAQVAGLLNTHDDKMGVSPNAWSEIGFDKKHMKTMVARCESDTSVLEQIYERTKHIIVEIKR